MSILVRPVKRSVANAVRSSEDTTVLESLGSAQSYLRHDLEAPDAGLAEGEASESRIYAREEPEARFTFSETPIYNGRSRS
jgi:hypothetical protein